METAILSKNQIAFFNEVKNAPFLTKNFYLTGGTALAAYYLHHRYSEDLDFFSENEIDPVNLDGAIESIKKKLNISKIDFQQSFNRNLFFLYFGKEALKTEFTYFPFPRIEEGKKENSVVIDSLLDIAVNKLFTIYQRVQARDYIDLYCIVRHTHITVAELIAKAKIKFDWHIDPLQLGTQFVKATEAKDYPRMIKDIPSEEWQSFFMDEAKKLKSDIIA